MALFCSSYIYFFFAECRAFAISSSISCAFSPRHRHYAYDNEWQKCLLTLMTARVACLFDYFAMLLLMLFALPALIYLFSPLIRAAAYYALRCQSRRAFAMPFFRRCLILPPCRLCH